MVLILYEASDALTSNFLWLKTICAFISVTDAPFRQPRHQEEMLLFVRSCEKLTRWQADTLTLNVSEHVLYQRFSIFVWQLKGFICCIHTLVYDLWPESVKASAVDPSGS
jgi:hypothetical protein